MTTRMTIARLHALVIEQQAAIEILNAKVNDLSEECLQLRTQLAEGECAQRAAPVHTPDTPMMGYAQANERAKALARSGVRNVKVVRNGTGFTVVQS